MLGWFFQTGHADLLQHSSRCGRSQRLDGLARVRALVQRVAAVAAHLVPDDVVAARLGEEPLPEVAVRDGLLLAVLPAGPLPALPPALAEAVHDVGAVRV